MENRMATAPNKPKSALDSLLDAFAEVIDEGAKKMNDAELSDSEKKFSDAVDRAVARKPRPEKA
jgi:hypothetical protein